MGVLLRAAVSRRAALPAACAAHIALARPSLHPPTQLAPTVPAAVTTRDRPVR